MSERDAAEAETETVPTLWDYVTQMYCDQYDADALAGVEAAGLVDDDTR